MQTALACLFEGFGEDLVAEAVNLDIHLAGGDAVASTSDLEVHVAEVVLVAKDVSQDGVFASLAVGDHTHGDASNGLAHWHTCIHQG